MWHRSSTLTKNRIAQRTHGPLRSSSRSYFCESGAGQLAWFVLLIGVYALSLPALAAGKAADADVVLLEHHEIHATRQSIHQFLDSLHPGGDVHERVKNLLAELGHDSFAQREAAMDELLKISTLPMGLVKLAAGGDDPEIRWRAQLVYEQAGKQSGQLLRAALRLGRDLLVLVTGKGASGNRQNGDATDNGECAELANHRW